MNKKSIKWLVFIWIFALCIAAVALVVISRKPKTEPKADVAAKSQLDTFGDAPSFKLTDHTGAEFNTDTLKGKVWVAEFFFSTCGSICPVMQRHLSKIQTVFEDHPDFRIVGLTVDPENDKPEVLAKYLEKQKGNPKIWTYLTGDKKIIYSTARDGFKLGVEEAPPPDPGGPKDFIHTEKFTLVDKQGKIRGYYNGTDINDMDRLIIDIETLLHE